MPNVDFSRVPLYYHRYINKVMENELMDALKKSQSVLLSTLKTLPSDKWLYRYSPGKWNVKEIVQHIMDAERVFCFRALCFARQDKTRLPGFDENSYAAHSNATNRSPQELIEELKSVQNATNFLFGSFSDEQMEQQGIANNNPIYVKGLGFIIAGHAHHHHGIIKERYLNEPIMMFE